MNTNANDARPLRLEEIFGPVIHTYTRAEVTAVEGVPHFRFMVKFPSIASSMNLWEDHIHQMGVFMQRQGINNTKDGGGIDDP